MTIAQQVEALVGPFPGSRARFLMNSPADTPAPVLSVRSQSRLAESATLTQADETMLRRMDMS